VQQVWSASDPKVSESTVGRDEEWILADPAGQSLAEIRPIRDEIEQRVRTLLDRLGVRAEPGE
jgi:hypothetical protein